MSSNSIVGVRGRPGDGLGHRPAAALRSKCGAGRDRSAYRTAALLLSNKPSKRCRSPIHSTASSRARVAATSIASRTSDAHDRRRFFLFVRRPTPATTPLSMRHRALERLALGRRPVVPGPVDHSSDRRNPSGRAAAYGRHTRRGLPRRLLNLETYVTPHRESDPIQRLTVLYVEPIDTPFA